jgi:hypothetical protein
MNYELFSTCTVEIFPVRAAALDIVLNQFDMYCHSFISFF